MAVFPAPWVPATQSRPAEIPSSPPGASPGKTGVPAGATFAPPGLPLGALRCRSRIEETEGTLGIFQAEPQEIARSLECPKEPRSCLGHLPGLPLPGAPEVPGCFHAGWIGGNLGRGQEIRRYCRLHPCGLQAQFNLHHHLLTRHVWSRSRFPFRYPSSIWEKPFVLSWV